MTLGRLARRCAAWTIAAGLSAMATLAAARGDTLRLALPAGAAAALYAEAFAHIVVPRLSPLTTVAIIPLPPDPPAPLATPWDLAAPGPVALGTSCAQHLVAPVAWSGLGGRGRFLPGATSDCGVGVYVHSIVLTWDGARVPGHPGWADFWNVVRFPGQRGVQQTPRGTLEIALMADGVAPRDVYATLRTKPGVDRAFRKLDQLRPYIVWWQHDPQALALVASGRVLMSSAPNEQVIAATRRLGRPFGLQWNGAVAMVQSLAISATTADGAEAASLIARLTDRGLQNQITDFTGLGGTVTPDRAHDDPARDAISPSAHLDQALVFDGGFWRDHGAALQRRFDAWLER